MRNAICFAGEFGDVSNFRDGAAKGFLAVNMLAGPHGSDTGDGMGVIEDTSVSVARRECV